MSRLEARRSERIDYQGAVELLAHTDGAALPCRVLARALDLGSGGMQLSAPVQMEVGAQVTCRVTLDGESASLPGRVAWLRERGSARHDQGHGMGICFDPLGSHESALLRNTVERSAAGYRAVELHFAGLDQPVVAHGQARAGGLRLSAALPILARGTELSFRLDQEGSVFTGKIGDAFLREKDGERCLEVDVDVLEASALEGEGVRFRRHARYGYATELDAHEGVERAAAGSPTPEHEQHGPSFTERSRRPWLAMLAAAAIGACVTWAVTQWPKPATQPEFVAHPRTERARDVAFDDDLRATGSSAAPLPRGAAEPPWAAPPTTLHSATSRSPAALQHSAGPGASSAPGTNDRDPHPVTGGESTGRGSAPTAALEGVAEAAGAPDVLSPAQATSSEPQPAPTEVSPGEAAEPPAPQPQVLVEAGATVVRVPFEGTLEHARSRLWAEPRALAVDLPDGRTPLALGRYPLNQGGVTDLQLNGRENQLLFRVKASVPIAAYELTIADGMLVARLVHAPSVSLSP